MPSSSKQPKQAHACTKYQFDVLGVQNDDTLEMGEASGDKKDVVDSQEICLANVCSKVFRSWDWTSNANFCPKGCRIILGWNADVVSLLHVVQNSPWVLMGDFNVALNMEDVSSGSSMLNSPMSDFKDCVANIEVLDVNCSGLHYTWNQKPKGSHVILKKLDRIMGNLGFVDKFLGAHAIFQPYRISDHAPAILKFPTLTKNKPKPF
ncbi:RNA-directed DNA polymerase, eukaryota, reverse transcriptase zinc-binding domain protein [Tanacetum coccineum]